jgi:hypothetical protein
LPKDSPLTADARGMKKSRNLLILLDDLAPRQWAEIGAIFLLSLGVAGLFLIPVISVGIVCSGRC